MDTVKLGNKRTRSKLDKEQKKIYKEQKLLKLHQQHVASTSKKADASTVELEQVAAIVPQNLSTLSIAVPGSILENAQTPILQAYLVGQIARAAAIYKVHEIVVFDDVEVANNEKTESFNGTTTRYCTSKFAKLLQYLECPQYLRKHIFPLHRDLEYVGLMNPLDTPHHLRSTDLSAFREGITCAYRDKSSRADVGLKKKVAIDRNLQPGVRVTVKLNSPQLNQSQIGAVVSPSAPELETGAYWGYSVRIANSITQVFSQSPYKGGYDLTVGTSEKGRSVDSLEADELTPYEHALIVFGGLKGLEQAMDSDPLQLEDDPMLIFDFYINSCPHQGSRTIRTEEAVLITLSALRTKLIPKNKYVLNDKLLKDDL